MYYDRFSPINLKTQSRVLTEMTATLGVFWVEERVGRGFLMVGCWSKMGLR